MAVSFAQISHNEQNYINYEVKLMITTIKTAISIQKSLFEQVENLAQKLNITQSEFFEIAIESFIKNYKNQKLLQEINKVYSDEQDTNDKDYLSKMRKYHCDIVRNEW